MKAAPETTTTAPSGSAEYDRPAAVCRLLYPYSEARALLGGVPKSTWNLWIAEGLVEPVRIGPRRCFIRHEDIQRLAQGGTMQKVS